MDDFPVARTGALVDVTNDRSSRAATFEAIHGCEKPANDAVRHRLKIEDVTGDEHHVDIALGGKVSNARHNRDALVGDLANPLGSK
jgi:hypothetical protein